MGWKGIDSNLLQKLSAHDRSVLVFSHTSYVDFYIFLLYKFAYPDELFHIRTLVKPDPFAYAGPLLRFLGAIPATKVSDKNGGAVSRIIDELKKLDKVVLMICPKGTIIKAPWRTGYYHIAKELKAPLLVVGLDYEKKTVEAGDFVSSEEPEHIVREQLYESLSHIVPLFPEDEVVPIRLHDHSKRSFMNWTLPIVVGIVSYFFYTSF